ncbi:RNA-binding protein [Candidatus Woesearchaeota archaeon]|nr:RNA-binding protein [Candidatus Woesearchaeota archaeon]
MSKLEIKDKQVVVPGEMLAEGMDYLPGFGTYRDKDKIIANRLGIADIQGRALKIIPLSGRYIPKNNDVVIGKVFDITFSGWRLDINSAYSGMLILKDATTEYIARGADLTQYYSLGDYLVCKITNVTSQKLVDLSMKGPGLKKLGKGRIISVNPHKVPRIIGKQGSMVNMIKNLTKCWVIVGQNGLIWLQGKPSEEVIAIKAIRKIESESHLPGLTERIKAFLESIVSDKSKKQDTTKQDATKQDTKPDKRPDTKPEGESQ